MNQPNNGPRVIAGATLVLLGVLFLLSQVFSFSIFGALWPFLIILPGAAFLYAAVNGDRNASGMAVPGSIITGTGLLLFFQNLTGHWESWAYAWTLYPVFLGLALMFIGRRTENTSTYHAGRGFVNWGGMAFLVLAALFELVIFSPGGIFGKILLPLLLVGLGAFLLTRGNKDGSSLKRKNEDAAFTGPAVVGRRISTSYTSASDDLRRRIDEALAEDDEQPKNISQN
jgi:hypothetical protein